VRNTKNGAVIGIGARAVGGAAGAIIDRRMDTKANALDEELENAEVERVVERIMVPFDSGLLFPFARLSTT